MLIKKSLNIFRDLKALVWNRNINMELMAALVLTALVPLIVINLYYSYKTNQFVENKVELYSSEIIRQMGKKTESILEQVEITKNQVLFATTYSELFTDYGDRTPADLVDMVFKTDQFLRNIRASFPAVLDIHLVDSNRECNSTNRELDSARLLGKDWVRDMDSLPLGDVVVKIHDADYLDTTHKDRRIPVISFIKKTVNIRPKSGIGILQIDVPYSELSKVIEGSNIGKNTLIFLSDNKNRVIYSTMPHFLGKDIGQVEYCGFNAGNTNDFLEMIKNKNGLEVNYKLEYMGWRIVGITPSSEIFVELKQVRYMSLLIILLSVVFAFILSFLFSRGITKPINNIIKTMKKVGEGNFDIQLPNASNRDLRILCSSFSLMVDKINTLMKNVIEQENEKKQAELKVLQAQITPHFLYNTLSVIKWMAFIDKNERIANAIVSLIKILDFSSRKYDNIIPVAEELEFIENYINIQKMKFGGSIEVAYDIDSEIYDYCTLKFTLQPIVENAIIHGLGNKNFCGLITIKGKVLEESIVFEVIDDGVGMDVNRKEKLTGIGIENVDTRIKLNFGHEYGLKIESSIGVGTSVAITLPKILRKES